jgi:hypothetical protein
LLVVEEELGEALQHTFLLVFWPEVVAVVVARGCGEPLHFHWGFCGLGFVVLHHQLCFELQPQT